MALLQDDARRPARIGGRAFRRLVLQACGVDTQGGAIVQGEGYVDYSFNDAISLRVGAGKVKSVHGGLDAPLVDAALVFRFGVDRRLSSR